MDIAYHRRTHCINLRVAWLALVRRRLLVGLAALLHPVRLQEKHTRQRRLTDQAHPQPGAAVVERKGKHE